MILDIHTHHPAPCAQAVVNASADSFSPVPQQLYSLGIHPWHTSPDLITLPADFIALAASPQVVTIGECGIDTMRGAPMWVQLKLFKAQALLAEELDKPLIVHDVKAHEIIVGMRKELHARSPWIIHGFRGKPQVAQMLLRAGCKLSFGERFNADTLREVPTDAIFAETDESQLPIRAIIEAMSQVRGEDMLPAIAANTATLLHL